LLQVAAPTILTALSYGVLDTAMVEMAAYCLGVVGRGDRVQQEKWWGAS